MIKVIHWFFLTAVFSFCSCSLMKQRTYDNNLHSLLLEKPIRMILKDTFYYESLIQDYLSQEFINQERCFVNLEPVSYSSYFKGIYLLSGDSIFYRKNEIDANDVNFNSISKFYSSTIGLSECIINGCSKEYYSGYYYMKFYLVMDVEFVGYCKWQIPCFGNCNFGNGLKFESFVPIYRILDIYEYELLK